MPITQTEICRDRSRARGNRPVEALTDTMMSNIGTNRNASGAVLRDTDTEAGASCGKLDLNTFSGQDDDWFS